jgi:hypothetical protein
MQPQRQSPVGQTAIPVCSTYTVRRKYHAENAGKGGVFLVDDWEVALAECWRAMELGG